MARPKALLFANRPPHASRSGGLRQKGRRHQERQSAESRPLEEAIKLPKELSKDLPLLHEALAQLATLDTRKANVVELRFFGGFTFAEIAKILEVAVSTVERDWKFARTWLRNEISGLEHFKSTESGG